MTTKVENRTEKPTERRRRMARESGRTVYSSDLTFSVRVLGTAIGLQYFANGTFNALVNLLTETLSDTKVIAPTVSQFVDVAWMQFFRMGTSVVGLIALPVTCGAFADAAQHGFQVNVAEVLPDVHRLRPQAYLSKVGSLENWGESILRFVKMSLALAFAIWQIESGLSDFRFSSHLELSLMAKVVWQEILNFSWNLSGVLLTIGIADYGLRYWQFERSLLMSHEEIREEQRDQGSTPSLLRRKTQ